MRRVFTAMLSLSLLVNGADLHAGALGEMPTPGRRPFAVEALQPVAHWARRVIGGVRLAAETRAMAAVALAGLGVSAYAVHSAAGHTPAGRQVLALIGAAALAQMSRALGIPLIPGMLTVEIPEEGASSILGRRWPPETWTSEESAVQAIRSTFKQRRPLLMALYETFDSLPSDQQAFVRREIYTLTTGHLLAWNLSSVLDQRTTPYFRGSFVLALQKVFPAAQLNPLGFNFDWTSEERAIESIRFVLAQEAPDLLERYDRRETLSPLAVERLRNDIYALSAGDFQAWKLHAALDRRRTPYFGGSYFTALRAVFPALDLNVLGFQLDWSTHERSLDSVEFVLRRERPQLFSAYDQIETLSDEGVERLRSDILEIKSADFEVWGIANALNRRVGHFQSYRHLLSELFHHPRLGLTPDQFLAKRRSSAHRQYVWTAGRDGAIANIRSAFEKFRPDLLRQYEMLPTLDSEAVASLRQAVYSIGHGQFGVWGIGAVQVHRSAPYFHGSYVEALQATFPELKLDPLGFQLDWSSRETAIASIRYVFSGRAPGLIDRYERYESLSEREVQTLKGQIYQIPFAVLNRWGLGAMGSQKHAPYFHGHYVEALQALFPKLDLDPLAFTLDWSTPEKGIDSVRFVLRREVPELLERYGKLDALSEDDIVRLKRDVASISLAHFIIWTLQSAIDRNLAPYFGGSYINALQAVFSRLGLTRDDFSKARQGERSLINEPSEFPEPQEDVRFAGARWAEGSLMERFWKGFWLLSLTTPVHELAGHYAMARLSGQAVSWNDFWRDAFWDGRVRVRGLARYAGAPANVAVGIGMGLWLHWIRDGVPSWALPVFGYGMFVAAAQFAGGIAEIATRQGDFAPIHHRFAQAA